MASFARNLVPSDNLPGGTLQCSNFTMWKRFHGTLCHLTLCRDDFARWPLCQLTTLVIDNLPVDHFVCWQFASWPFCHLIILPVDHFASWPFCQLKILPVGHFASWPFYQTNLGVEKYARWHIYHVAILLVDNYAWWQFCQLTRCKI